MARQWSGEVGGGKGRCVGSLCMGHLRVTVGHPRVTIGHPRHIGSEKVSMVCCSVSRLSRFALRMRAILLLCQSVGHLSEVLK